MGSIESRFCASARGARECVDMGRVRLPLLAVLLTVECLHRVGAHPGRIVEIRSYVDYGRCHQTGWRPCRAPLTAGVAVDTV